MVREENDRVTFLYKIRDGSADRSYGINVARLAGLPETVLERARGLQKELESKKRIVQQSYQLVEMKKEDPVASEICSTLKAVNTDDLSPRQACKMLGCSESVYVGDSATDIEAGINAGSYTVAALTKPEKEASLLAAGPDASIRRLSELRELLKD